MTDERWGAVILLVMAILGAAALMLLGVVVNDVINKLGG